MNCKVPMLAISCLLVLGASAPRISAQESPVSPLERDYRLVVDDRIEIVVEGKSELSRSYLVPGNGEVSFPPLGRLMLLDRSLPELEEEIKTRLRESRRLLDPSVFVMIGVYAPRKAFLLGAVAKTIDLPVHTQYGIVEVLSMAGVRGFGTRGMSSADLRKVTIMRKSANGTPFRFTVNVEDVLERGDFRKNVVVMPNDVIYIPLLENRSTMASVYVLGKVKSPGKYPFQAGRDQMTLTKLIALAGDFHQFADQGSIKILRKEGNRTIGIEVDFDDIIDLEQQDVVLQPDDLIYVPESPI